MCRQCQPAFKTRQDAGQAVTKGLLSVQSMQVRWGWEKTKGKRWEGRGGGRRACGLTGSWMGRRMNWLSQLEGCLTSSRGLVPDSCGKVPPVDRQQQSCTNSMYVSRGDRVYPGAELTQYTDYYVSIDRQHDR